MLKTKVIQQIALFQAMLRQYYDNIKTRIEDINQPLFEIDYNAGRYIKLNCEENPDAEIKEFRAKLKACTEEALSVFDNGSHGEEKFYQVREIIERFRILDERYALQGCTDLTVPLSELQRLEYALEASVYYRK